jgi:hypothetical protein
MKCAGDTIAMNGPRVVRLVIRTEGDREGVADTFHSARNQFVRPSEIGRPSADAGTRVFGPNDPTSRRRLPRPLKIGVMGGGQR